MKGNLRYSIITTAVLITLWLAIQQITHTTLYANLEIPDVWIDYHKPLYNESKVALIIENRPQGILAPLILHMMSAVPRIGASGLWVQRHRRQVAAGKLDLTYIPTNMSVLGREPISQFLTNLWLYDTVLAPAEHLLLFQTDSVMCTKSLDSLDNWLHYDWVGASWGPNKRGGGNGGLSLRKVSAIVKVLQHQNRLEGSDFEDGWLTDRLTDLVGGDVANGTESLPFSVDQYWHDAPLGYHTGGGKSLVHHNVWGQKKLRDHIYEYCPEIQMTLEMDLGTFIPKTCHEEW